MSCGSEYETQNCITCTGKKEKNYIESCNMTDWKYNKESKQEKRTCEKCDYTITKLHVHTEPSADLEYVLDKSKNNGKHELKAEYKCGICEEKVTLPKEEDCKLSDWKYNKETKQEERTCKVCDYKVTKEHEHSQAPSNLDYSFDKSNNNGNHQLKAIFNSIV